MSDENWTAVIELSRNVKEAAKNTEWEVALEIARERGLLVRRLMLDGSKDAPRQFTSDMLRMIREHDLEVNELVESGRKSVVQALAHIRRGRTVQRTYGKCDIL